MRNLIILLFVVLISNNVVTLAQSQSDGSSELIRQNPHGWFALQLPRDLRRLDGPRDVDGRRYESAALGINFDYSSLDQLRTEYAMRFLEPAPHMAPAKYFIDRGNRLQGF